MLDLTQKRSSRPSLSLPSQGSIFLDKPELQNQEIEILGVSHSPSISPGNWSGGKVFIYDKLPSKNSTADKALGSPTQYIKQENFYSGANFEIRDASASGTDYLTPPQD